MLKIIVPDPGLKEYSGHHPAMFESLVGSQHVSSEDIHFDFYSNQDISDKFVSSSQNNKNIRIIKHFKTDFYQFFYQNHTLFEMNGYVNQLVKEYLNLFNRYRESNKEDVLFLYHTLHWEHALALSSAISLFKSATGKTFRHCAFLMFNPRKYDDKEKLNSTRYLNFKLAFDLLAKQSDVDCFVGEHELKSEYQDLLGQSINIHPCGLINRNKLDSVNLSYKKSKVNKKSIILYTGDAKSNKGFEQLPRMASLLTLQYQEPEVCFIIQYTLTNQKPELLAAEQQLQRLALSDKRIILIDKFWSNDELHHTFSNALAIVFNYEAKAYQNQSSGVLWLAAFYQLKMIFLTNTWLNREAQRLDCDFMQSTKDNWQIIIEDYINKNADNRQANRSDTVTTTNCYREVLFKNMLTWLNNIYNQSEEMTC